MKDGFVLFEGEPVPVRKILCAGRNYRAHADEIGEAVPSEPILFLKPVTALAHPGGGDLFISEDLGLLHHEVEVAVLLGGGGKSLSPLEAGKLACGWGVVLDLTLRQMQARAKRAGAPWALSKGFDGSLPVGAFVSRGRAGDPNDLAVTLEVNGVLRQEGHTSRMIFRPEEILSFASRFMTLEEGDLLLTGTPEGVGALEDGDSVVARAGGLPELAFTIRR